MKGHKSIVLFCFAALIGCNNLNDAKPEQRNSFVYFYPSDVSTYCTAAAQDKDGGYVLVGFSLVNDDLNRPKLLIVKTDSRGKSMPLQNTSLPDSLYGRSILPVDDGYLIAADRIQVKSQSGTQTTNFNINFMKTDRGGNILYRFQTRDTVNSFLANAMTSDANGNIVLLGTRVQGLNNRLASVRIFTPTVNKNGYQLLWAKEFDLLGRNYTNGRSVELTSNNDIIWSSSLTTNLTGKSYASFPTIKPFQTFNNSQRIGENDDQNNIIAADLKKNNAGFGAIGTNYTLLPGTSTSTNLNFFFVRLGVDGSPLANSIQYFDGGNPIKVQSPDDLAKPENNTIEDAGITLSTTSDGGYLLVGYLESRPARDNLPARGNGGKDVLLVKIDAFGNVQWNKSYGGIGDEVASSVFQTADGGYLVAGTSTISGFSSIFLLKTNSLGELND